MPSIQGSMRCASARRARISARRRRWSLQGSDVFRGCENRSDPFFSTLSDAPGECVRERSAVHIFELAADRYAVRDATCLDLAFRGELPEKMRGGLAFHRRIRREND